MGKVLDNLIKWMDSPEGQKKLEEERIKMQFIVDLEDKYVEKFNSIGIEKRGEIIEKIITKYNSDKYRNKEYSRGREPLCSLYWYLDDYANKYGEKLPDEEDNPFPHCKSIIDGKYVVRKMYGQGTVIDVWNVNREQK